MKIRNMLLNGVGILGIAYIASGCQVAQTETMPITINGHPYIAEMHRLKGERGKANDMNIGTDYGDGSMDVSKPQIRTHDWNGDYRAEDIELKFVPKGHELEKLVNLDSLASIEKRLLEKY